MHTIFAVNGPRRRLLARALLSFLSVGLVAGQIESTRRNFMRLDSGAWLQDVAENVDRLTIEQLLDLHDLVLAPLCPATKRRIVGAAALPALPPAGEASLPIAA